MEDTLRLKNHPNLDPLVRGEAKVEKKPAEGNEEMRSRNGTKPVKAVVNIPDR